MPQLLSVALDLEALGGSESYALALNAELARHGWRALTLSSSARLRADVPGAAYFVEGPRFDHESVVTKARAGLELARQTRLRQVIERILETEDIALAHFHTLSPYLASDTVIRALRRRRIPVVVTLHGYHAICPAGDLYSHTEDRRCDRCVGHHYGRLIGRNCQAGAELRLLRDVFMAVNAYALYYRGTWREGVDRFIAPSRFMLAQMIRGGYEPEKLRYQPHFAARSEPSPTRDTDAFLLAGRLTETKGVLWMLKVFAGLPQRLFIAGEGECLAAVLAAAAAHPNIKYLGRLSRSDLSERMSACSAVLVPSQWHENAPMVIYESFARGVPVLGSDLGGIPELIGNDERGRVIPPDDLDAWRRAISDFAGNRGLLDACSQRALEFSRAEHSADGHVRAIIREYESCLASVSIRATKASA
jgi:glycosyltransferase involved in cell wall biosynthesis